MRDFLEFMAGLLGIGACVVLGLALIIWPISYYDTKAEIREFQAVELTLKTARANQAISAVELAAIQQKVVDANRWLARIAYWNSGILGLWIPDAVDSLKPIY